MMRLLQVLLMFIISFFPSTLSTRSLRATIKFCPLNPKYMLFSENFSKFFLLIAVHSTQRVLLLTVQLATLLAFFVIISSMTNPGSPMYEAERVKTAGKVSSSSYSVSSTWSSMPISETCANFPKPSSSGMGIQLMELQPDCVNFAVMSPMVRVRLLPRQIDMVLSVALTQLKIQLRNEFSEVESKRMEMAPSMRPLRLFEMEVAEMKLVDYSWSWSCSPYMKSPNITSSKKLLRRLESRVVKLTDCDRSNYPRITYDDPSIMASSFSVFSSLLLWNFDITFFFTALALSMRVSLTNLHFWLVLYTVQSGPLIQLSGAVRSAASATCLPSLTKGMTYDISFSQQISLYSASWLIVDQFLQVMGSSQTRPCWMGIRTNWNSRQLLLQAHRSTTIRNTLDSFHINNYYNSPNIIEITQTLQNTGIKRKLFILGEREDGRNEFECGVQMCSILTYHYYHSMLNCSATLSLSASYLCFRLHSSASHKKYQNISLCRAGIHQGGMKVDRPSKLLGQL